MSAQTAQEPSMEDILASIRKIISEDSKDEAASEIAPTPVANRNSSMDQPSKAEEIHSPAAMAPAVSAPVQNPLLVERREMQDADVVPPSVATHELGTTPQRDHMVNAISPDAPRKSAAIPGFVERKPAGPAGPAGNVFEPAPQNASVPPAPPARMEKPLHPAIANAKAFVTSNIAPDQDHPQNSNAEKPVFQNTNSIGLQEVTAPLISPDSIERRDDDERRNHPLRRGADRDDEDFKQALMSPGTDDAIASAFEQLKNSATDNLDGKVEALLRPMLREWLDNNLPSMVERLVRDEIERVSRGD